MNYTKYDIASLADIRGKREAQIGVGARYTLYDGFFTKFLTLIFLNHLESEKLNKEDVRRLLAEAVKISYNSVLLAKEHDLGIQRTILARVMGLPDAFFDRQIQLVPFPFDQLGTLGLAPVATCLSTAREQRPDFLSFPGWLPLNRHWGSALERIPF